MEKAIACYTVGELFWEFFRFAPHVFYKKVVEYKDEHPKLIVLTRPDRFDIYGKYADIFIPLDIIGDNQQYIQNSFRLDNFPIDQYNQFENMIYKSFKDMYEILEVIKPDVSKAKFSDKQQFDSNKMLYDFNPRSPNIIEVDQYITKRAKVVTLAPRFRSNMKRNWIYWQEFYDMIYESGLTSKFDFVICGKYPDYIPDKKNRFFDINNIPITNEISTIGPTTECIKKSILTIGSQLGIPNLSLLLKTPVFSSGNEEKQQNIEYNIKKTKVHFLKDPNFDLDYKIIFEKIKIILSEYDD